MCKVKGKQNVEKLVFESFNYGEIKYVKEEVINFEKGILGFEDLHNFILKDIEENQSFKLLHSLEDNRIAFVVLNPFDFIVNYEIDLDEVIIRKLDIKTEEDVYILNTVTLNSDPSKITTNLRAPIVINIKNNKAKQFILKNEEYKIKHSLMEAE
ncbi:MAG: flagellar assembly protein FliW [Sarcina sp.]